MPLKSKKGFTLIEILIYLAIVGVLVSGFVFFALFINAARSKVYVMQEVQANARLALGLLAQKIRAAENVVAPLPGQIEEYLVLDMPLSLPNLSFNVVAGVLGITEQGGDFTPLINSKVRVKDLSFFNTGQSGEKDNIKIQLSLEYNGPASKEFEYSQSLQTSVTRRR